MVLSITLLFFGKFLSDFKLEKQTNKQTSIFDECVGVLNQYLIRFYTISFPFKKFGHNIANQLYFNKFKKFGFCLLLCINTFLINFFH